MIAESVRAEADAIRARFLSARPFRHVVIEDFFAPATLDALLAQFPPFDTRRALNEAGQVGGKAVVERIRAIGPAYAALDDLIQSREFLELVSRWTGIPDLRYDPHYFGGGTHENRHGQDLDAHVDFNRHPIERWHRRLNLIVYLNADWQASWGGNLELHSDPRAADDQITRIVPALNRCVIFETNEISWHGFSRIDLPPAEQARSRKSIALYFYTDTRPAEELADTHSTIYVDQPLPEQLVPGHTLSPVDVETLRILFTRRDDHIQRLYRDITRQEKELEVAREALRRGFVGRVYHLLRRIWGRLRRSVA